MNRFAVGQDLESAKGLPVHFCGLGCVTFAEVANHLAGWVHFGNADSVAGGGQVVAIGFLHDLIT